jgi:hypothetical protein
MSSTPMPLVSSSINFTRQVNGKHYFGSNEMDEVAQTILAITLLIATVCGFANYTNVKDNEAMIAMVEKGVDPQKAACAVKGSTDINKQVCQLIAK